MKAREIVREIMVNKGFGNAAFARKLDIEPTALWDRLNSKKVKDIPTSLLCEMLGELEYKLQIVPTNIPLPAEGYEISEPAKVDEPKLISEVDGRSPSDISPITSDISLSDVSPPSSKRKSAKKIDIDLDALFPDNEEEPAPPPKSGKQIKLV